MELLLLVPFSDVRRNFLLRELAHGLHQGFVVVSKLKVNHIHRLHGFLAVRKYETLVFEGTGAEVQ
jgi:hypothetical protein